MKVGIIGASFAKAAYLPALRHTPGAEVVAVASARLESAQEAAKAFGVPHAYDDWERMLGEHAFDLVCIATPTVTHAPMTLAALEAGAHVLCEKPTAMNADEAKAMWERAEALGRVHMIDHELRFNPNRKKVKELVASGAIGEVRHANLTNITSAWGDPASRPKGDWWSLEEQGGGRLGANGSHQVDLLRWWLGEVVAVSGPGPDDGAGAPRQAHGRALDGDRRRHHPFHASNGERRARAGLPLRRGAAHSRQPHPDLRQRGHHPAHQQR
jgi:predicted dehydrogenase